MVIVISPETLEACKKFTEERMLSSAKLYAKRGEQNLEKIFKDILGGTIAEFAVQAYLLSDGSDCTDPDLEIYSSRAKSYAPDLFSAGKRIHVKSQSRESAERHGLSWSFQKKDPLVWGAHEKDFIVLTQTDGNAVTIKAVVKAQNLLDNYLFSDPRNTSYSHTKTVVYFEELLASGIDIWEL